MEKIINVGCGQSPIEGAINIDNSFSVRMARHPFLTLLFKCFLNEKQKEYIEFCKKTKIMYANCIRLPFESESVDIVYSSHMCEHLYEEDLAKFLSESYRVLKPGGILRIVIPDLDIRINRYMIDKNADAFMNSLTLDNVKRKLTGKDRILYVLFGGRKHKWMYNGESFKQLVETKTEFKGYVLKAGETHINGEAKGKINLMERLDDSVYLEFEK